MSFVSFLGTNGQHCGRNMPKVKPVSNAFSCARGCSPTFLSSSSFRIGTYRLLCLIGQQSRRRCRKVCCRCGRSEEFQRPHHDGYAAVSLGGRPLLTRAASSSRGFGEHATAAKAKRPRGAHREGGQHRGHRALLRADDPLLRAARHGHLRAHREREGARVRADSHHLRDAGRRRGPRRCVGNVSLA